MWSEAGCWRPARAGAGLPATVHLHPRELPGNDQGPSKQFLFPAAHSRQGPGTKRPMWWVRNNMGRMEEDHRKYVGELAAELGVTQDL